MSVRRLADDPFQPGNFAFSEANAKWAEATIRKYPEGRQQSAVIPLLMRAQDQEGWITKPALEYVADVLKMPMIRVLEVATFYTQFQLKPVGTRAHVQVCGTTPCMLRGAEAIKDVCRAKIHPEPFHRNEDGTMSWEEVECLGACVNAPMVLIRDDTYEDLEPERFADILDLFEAGRGDEVTPGPQNGRHQSVPLGGLTSLTGDYDDLIQEQNKDKSGGPASGAGDQGAGAGRAVSTPPSDAGRPNSDAAETDPTIEAPGKATNGNANPAAEPSESDELVDKGHRSGSGRTGGTRQGRTDSAQRDAAEADQVSTETPRASAPLGGTRQVKEAAAEDAVVRDDAQVDDSASAQARHAVEPADLSGKYGKADLPLEGQRAGTSDTRAGPAHDDTFASREGGREETTPPVPGQGSDSDGEGERPADLLDAPKGEKDDLKRIRGIGPVIELKLNDLGVYHFWQIARWREPELLWVDNFLNFRGRAVREGWTGQAATLHDEAPSGENRSRGGQET